MKFGRLIKNTNLPFALFQGNMIPTGILVLRIPDDSTYFEHREEDGTIVIKKPGIYLLDFVGGGSVEQEHFGILRLNFNITNVNNVYNYYANERIIDIMLHPYSPDGANIIVPSCYTIIIRKNSEQESVLTFTSSFINVEEVDEIYSQLFICKIK